MSTACVPLSDAEAVVPSCDWPPRVRRRERLRLPERSRDDSLPEESRSERPDRLRRSEAPVSSASSPAAGRRRLSRPFVPFGMPRSA